MIHGSCEVFNLQCGDFELGKTVKTIWSVARIILSDTAHRKYLVSTTAVAAGFKFQSHCCCELIKLCTIPLERQKFILTLSNSATWTKFEILFFQQQRDLC